MEIYKSKYLPLSKHVLWLDTNTDILKIWDNTWTPILGSSTNNELVNQLIELLSDQDTTTALKSTILYGPYSSKEAAYAAITSSNAAKIGLTVGILTTEGVVEYLFKEHCDSINDLVIKVSSTVGQDGQDGLDGTDGLDGKSAYEVWLLNGHTGTEADFLTWLKADSFVTSITTDGILTDANGKQWQLVLYTPAPTIESITYLDPTISIYYQNIPSIGGTVRPSIVYSQVKKTTWSDGSTTNETVNTGATITYLNAAEDGAVTASANNDTTIKTIANVIVTVTLNDKTSSKSVTVKQNAKVINHSYYIGNILSTVSNFNTLSTEDLVSNASEISINATKTDSYTASKSCVYLMIPSTLNLTKFQYTSGGLTTDIIANNMFNLAHADVTINSITYKVYGYRSGGITTSDPLTFDYQVKY